MPAHPFWALVEPEELLVAIFENGALICNGSTFLWNQGSPWFTTSLLTC